MDLKITKMGFLHSYLPQPILFEAGFITVYWYGFFMALSVFAGLLVSLRVAQWHKVDKEIIYDLFFYVVIAGFIGARIFYVLYNPVYFFEHPLDMVKIWQGGIAIYGGILFGALAVWYFCRHLTPLSTPPLIRGGSKGGVFWLLAAIITPGLALGQAIGRWGNYFNQELFGSPTNLPWGIPIELINRPAGFESFNYFHPAFLYESIGNLVIFGILLWLHWRITLNTQHSTRNTEGLNSNGYVLCVTCYVLLYSMLRFAMEFLRIDEVLMIGGMRITQGLSLLIIIVILLYWRTRYYLKT